MVNVPKIDYEKVKLNIKKATDKTTVLLKTHWIDYVLLFFICLVLGAFDIFVLKRSDKFLSAEYWYHAFCRIVAYVLAGILGVRIGYPIAKNACNEFWVAMAKNNRLLLLRELNSVLFGTFISGINIEVKKSAWRAKINRKLARLDKFSPAFFRCTIKSRKKNILTDIINSLKSS